MRAIWIIPLALGALMVGGCPTRKPKPPVPPTAVSAEMEVLGMT